MSLVSVPQFPFLLVPDFGKKYPGVVIYENDI